MFLLSKDSIQLDVQVNDPIEAIRISGELLVKGGYAKEEYIEAMVKGYKEVGSYIVIAPGIAIPHARPERGALDTGFSLVRLKVPVEFGHKKNDPVKIVSAFSGVGNDGHIEMLQKISSIFGDKTKYNQIIKSATVEEIFRIINH